MVLPTYFALPLTQICVGAKQAGNGSIKWLKLSLKSEQLSLMNVVTGSDQLPFQPLKVTDWTAVFAPTQVISTSTSQGVSLEVDQVKVRLGLAWKDSAGVNGFVGVGSYDNWQTYDHTYLSCGYGLSDFAGTSAISSFCFVFVQ